MENQYIAAGLSPLSGRPGGKYYLTRAIIERLPAHKTYCEPFCGAAWVLFKKGRAATECLNDSDKDIVNFFETVRAHYAELCARAKWVLHSRVMQRLFLAEPPPGWEDDPVERAFRYYYLQSTAYRGRAHYGQRPTFASGPSAHRIYSRTYFQKQLDWAFQRLERVILECLDWRQVLELYDGADTLFYLDPPYPRTAFNYGRPWSWAEYAELARALGRVKGRFLCSLNDLPECRELFAMFHIEQISLRGSLDAQRKFRKELFISNYNYGQKTINLI